MCIYTCRYLYVLFFFFFFFYTQEEDVIPPSELRGHISTLKEDMSRMDACSSYRLSCLEQLMKLSKLLQYTDGFVRVKDMKKKGIPFTRTKATPSQYSGSSETTMSRTSPSESSGISKMRRPKSFEGSIGNYQRMPSDPGARGKSRGQLRQTQSTSDKDCLRKKKLAEGRNQSYGRHVRYDRKDRNEGRRVRYDRKNENNELHLPPIVNEKEKDTSMREISSSEVNFRFNY